MLVWTSAVDIATFTFSMALGFETVVKEFAFVLFEAVRVVPTELFDFVLGDFSASPEWDIIGVFGRLVGCCFLVLLVLSNYLR